MPSNLSRRDALKALGFAAEKSRMENKVVEIRM